MHTLPMEMLLYLAATARQEDVKRFVSLYLTRLRLVRPILDGEALIAMGLSPGPEFRGVMEQLLAARLDGEIESEEQERTLALKLITLKNQAGVL
jgi:tRNA nucleotidyltransferase (CCA-adding enzyme)